ncbi:MAG: hypothetical protein KatS3mg129_0230 [Leptospiraceae bacterium]|nr:MAG: hypothetical protein KatS3mg129_0230 [Leptospiraceae bacterium]
MKKYIILIIIFILTCKTFYIKPTEYKTNDINEGIQYLENWILHLMKQYKVVGLSLIVVDNKNILWQLQAGYQDKEKQIPVSEHTNFQIGSIAKVINTIAILKLVQEKKLQLDDPIHKYTEDLPIDYDYKNPITIRQLLIHHSGIPSDLMKYLWQDKYIELSEITKEIKQIYLSFKPDEIFSYSNLAVTLSGRIIEIITKQPYSLYINQLLKELEMNHTYTNLYQVTQLSKGYNIGLFGNKELNEPPIVMIPAGGFYSNAMDLAKFMQMILNYGYINNKQFLQKEFIEEMFRIQNKNILLDDEFKIGLPFFLNDLGFGKLKQANHGGDTIAYHSMMILLPELPLGIIVMTNTTTGSQITSKIALETISFFAKYKYNIIKSNQFDIPVNHAIYDAKQIFGHYNTSSGMIKIHYNDNEKLFCQYLNYSCEFILDNHLYRFRIKIFNFIPVEIFGETKFIFKKINQKTILYAVNGSTTIPFGSKIDESLSLNQNPEYFNSKEIWEKRIGEYLYINNTEKEPFFYIKKLTISKKDNFFLIQIYYNQSSYPIIYYAIPYKKDILKIPGYGRQLGDIIKFYKDTIYYSGFYLKKSDFN